MYPNNWRCFVSEVAFLLGHSGGRNTQKNTSEDQVSHAVSPVPQSYQDCCPRLAKSIKLSMKILLVQASL